MNRNAIVKRARSLTRDLNNNTFRNIDVEDYINEGIERCINVIPELRGMKLLIEDLDVPTHLPSSYHSLLGLYSASRLFLQDERHHQATNLMNEFEVKLAELKDLIDAGDLIILDELGNVVVFVGADDYVRDVYFTKLASDDDIIM